MRKTKDAYTEFIKSKAKSDEMFGFEPISLGEDMFPFQRHLTEWSIRKGRCSLFEDCGLGKTYQEEVWADNVVRHENKAVLILTPLAVGPQMVKEGEKFGIEVRQIKDCKVWKKGINVCNYERLHLLDPDDWAGVVCDESGILKHSTSKTRNRVNAFLSRVKYRLLATATPSPNDFVELGNSSEVLGVMGYQQMLGMFFSNGGEDTQSWVLKGHAKKRFWRWVCTWARALRKPSDLGYSDDGFVLPELKVVQHVVKSPEPEFGFGLDEAATLDDQRIERKATLRERCEKVAEIVPKKDFCVVWCHLNSEGVLLERLIPGSVQVAGKDEEKEERFAAFAAGQIKTLITKPKMGGWGLNWQHCNRMTTFPSHSYESFYQSIRRCWRFGQKRPVTVDVVSSRAESRVVRGMDRKERQMNEMFSSLVSAMNEYQLDGKKQSNEELKLRFPKWL